MMILFGSLISPLNAARKKIDWKESNNALFKRIRKSVNYQFQNQVTQRGLLGFFLPLLQCLRCFTKFLHETANEILKLDEDLNFIIQCGCDKIGFSN